MPVSPLPAIRQHLLSGPKTARMLASALDISQPTISRALSALAETVVRFGPYRSIHYALRRQSLTDGDIPVYRVTPAGQIEALGTLIAVHPNGFVMRQHDGQALHSEGLPWWLDDMRPQGYLGRSFVAARADALGLPASLADWQDHHVLRALLGQPGSDTVGNLLLGDVAREHFIRAPLPEPLPLAERADAYARLAAQTARGELPGSSAGGEQPKFVAHTLTPDGLRHVIVKFTLQDASNPVGNPLNDRWRDLLLSEHRALTLLRRHDIAAVTTHLIDRGSQRFLEVERFDRVGTLGRRGLISLAAMDAEFVGLGRGGWPAVTERLMAAGHITRQAHEATCLLHAFGVLIGNTDMHAGNLSFITDSGRPYSLAPAYDMLPMAFAPRSSGELPTSLAPATLSPLVSSQHWRNGLDLAAAYLAELSAESGLSSAFTPCLTALKAHLADTTEKIRRLA